jgi:hypothetical protein
VNVDLLGELYDGYIMIERFAELLRALQEAESTNRKSGKTACAHGR